MCLSLINGPDLFVKTLVMTDIDQKGNNYFKMRERERREGKEMERKPALK